MTISPVSDPDTIIQQTKNWIQQIVIGLGLCPFAAREFENNRIDYTVSDGKETEQHLRQLADCFSTLDKNATIETSLLIYSDSYQQFDDYLELLYLANRLVENLKYVGIYQIASFHPDYRFEGSKKKDAANFTNRSPYPMLHILREHSIEKAIENYDNIESVPDDNIKKLQKIGFENMLHKLKTLYR